MLKPDKRLLFLVLAILATTAYFSCTQPDDVFTAVGQTTLSLEVERLPQPPAGMVYELWVCKTTVSGMNIPVGDLVSLGKFSFSTSNATGQQFLNVDGSVRDSGSVFVLAGDLYNYNSLFVSLEPDPDDDLASPGPVMLVDNIVKIEDFAPTLNFPLEDVLWDGTIRYNLQTMSDDNRNANIGRGIWLSSYRSVVEEMRDTTGIDTVWEEIEYDPEVDTIVNGIETTFDTAYLKSEVIEDIQIVTEQIIFSKDTIILGAPVMHTRVTFNQDSVVTDSVPPLTYRQLSNTVPPYDNHLGVPFNVRLDIFTQDDFGLPDYTGWGWKWQGWVVSPYLDTGVTAPFTPPAWTYKTQSVNWIPGDTGGIITTGTFGLIDTVDDGDPYTFQLLEGQFWSYDTTIDTAGAIVETTVDSALIDKYKRPYYPGEEFLDQAALEARYPGIGTVNFMPPAYNGFIEGTAFVTLEPIIRLSDTTNFPLIAFLGAIPSSVELLNAMDGVVDMIGRHSSVPGQTEGFPEIKVHFVRL